jgi:hypothetical protein
MLKRHTVVLGYKRSNFILLSVWASIYLMRQYILVNLALHDDNYCSVNIHRQF